MRSKILETREDRQWQRQKELENDYPCDCGHSDVEAVFVSNRYFRGWQVTCLCGTITAEIDED